MQIPRRLAPWLPIALALLAAAPSPARAHGAGHTVVEQPVAAGGLAVQFILSSGEAMADAAVTLFAPDGTLHQTGRSDRLGRVAFVPDRPGPWRIEIADAAGHQAAKTFEIGPDRAQPPPPAWRRWLLRFSLAANLLLLGLLVYGRPAGLGRRRRAAPVSDHPAAAAAGEAGRR
jgi:nickel transport protein